MMPNTIFNGLSIYIDGNFSEYFNDKKQVKSILESLGAKISPSLTNNVDIFLTGKRVTNNTFELLFELQERGFDIEIIFEFELYYKLLELGIDTGKETLIIHEDESERFTIDEKSGYTTMYIAFIKLQAVNAIQREQNGNLEAVVPLYKKLLSFNYKDSHIMWRLIDYYHISRQYDQEIAVIDLLIENMDQSEEYYNENLETLNKIRAKAVRFKS